MQRTLTLALGVVLSLGAATAQGIVSYPQDTLRAPSSTPIPLGYSALPLPPLSAESRYQQLIPATHLPTLPCAITALAFPTNAWTGALQYGLLEVTMSATTGPELSMNFAANLPAPVSVLAFAGWRTWREREWHVLVLDRPFRHDGSSSLVIEIRKTIRGVSGGPIFATNVAGPNILGRPPGPALAVQTSGAIGSGAANQPLGTLVVRPMQIALLVDTPTITVRSDPNGRGVMFAVGGTVEIAVYGPAGSPYSAFLGVDFAPRFTIPGIRGAGLIAAVGHLPLRMIGRDGRDALAVELPADRALVGQRFTLQGGLTPLNEVPILTNAVEFTVLDA